MVRLHIPSRSRIASSASRLSSNSMNPNPDYYSESIAVIDKTERRMRIDEVKDNGWERRGEERERHVPEGLTSQRVILPNFSKCSSRSWGLQSEGSLPTNNDIVY